MACMNLFRAGVCAQGLLQLLAPDFADKCVERFVDVVPQCCRGLEKWAAKLVGQVLALLGGDAALGFQVHLIGDQHQWDVLGKAHPGY